MPTDFIKTPALDALLALKSPVDLKEIADKTAAKELQFVLKQAGFDCGAIDGFVGAKTLEAFAKFKKSKYLNQPTLISAGSLALLEAVAIAASAVGAGKIATKVNKAGLELIKSFEGLRLTAYLCPANVPTIGYGSTHGLTRQDVGKRKITEQEAEQLLIKDLQQYEAAVQKLVKVPLSDNAYASLTALCYNIGVGAFGRSSVLKKLNRGDRQGAADAFLLWNRAKGKVLPGLTRRRQAERTLFLK